MSDKPKRPEDLDEAFAQVDLFQGELERLKRKYNETAKEVAELSKVVTGPGALPTKPTVDGRFATTGPFPSERPGVSENARLPVPRPTPKPREVKETIVPSRPSGRFYIQVPKGGSPEELSAARDKLSKLGRIVDSGVGTASRSEAGWVELAVRNSDIRELIDKLKRNELQEYVEKVIEVEPGEGRLQARQIELFRLKNTSGTDT